MPNSQPANCSPVPRNSAIFSAAVSQASAAMSSGATAASPLGRVAQPDDEPPGMSPVELSPGGGVAALRTPDQVVVSASPVPSVRSGASVPCPGRLVLLPRGIPGVTVGLAVLTVDLVAVAVLLTVVAPGLPVLPAGWLAGSCRGPAATLPGADPAGPARSPPGVRDPLPRPAPGRPSTRRRHPGSSPPAHSRSPGAGVPPTCWRVVGPARRRGRSAGSPVSASAASGRPHPSRRSPARRRPPRRLRHWQQRDRPAIRVVMGRRLAGGSCLTPQPAPTTGRGRRRPARGSARPPGDPGVRCSGRAIAASSLGAGPRRYIGGRSRRGEGHPGNGVSSFRSAASGGPWSFPGSCRATRAALHRTPISLEDKLRGRVSGRC